MNNKHRATRWGSERGQSMVEAALTLPLILLVLCGILDFGWIFTNQLMMSNCSREGARYAAVNSTQSGLDAAVTQSVRDAVTIGDPEEVSVTLEWTDEGGVRVVVSKQLPVLTPIAGVFTAGQKVLLQSATTMRVS